MSIPMTVLVPVQNDGEIAARNELGFQPLKPAYGLSQISELVTANLPDGAGAAIANAGETAIPDVCAHVQYLRAQLNDGNDLNMDDEAVRAWVGVMAIIALSEHRSRQYTLTVNLFNMNGDANHANDPMLSVYREALQRENLLDADKNLHVLYLNSNPIAVMDVPGAGVNTKRCYCYPFSTIDNPARVMNQIAWFEDNDIDLDTGNRIAHRWKNVLDDDTDTGLPYLDRTERILFAEWLDALKANGTDVTTSSVDYDAAVTSVLQRLSQNTDVVRTSGELIRVEDTFHAPLDRPQNLDDWRGVLACVGLSALRGREITFESYNVRAAEDPYRSVLLRHNGVEKFILVLVKGVRIGRLDNYLLIRPLYCVTDSLTTADIPWYQNGQWVDITSGVADGAMHRTERRRLAQWYRAVSADASLDMIVRNQLMISADRLEAVFGIGAPGGGTDMLAHEVLTDLTPMPTNFITPFNKFFTVPVPANILPQVMFTDHLVLTMQGTPGGSSKLGLTTPAINNQIQLNGSDSLNPTPETFLALLPLHSSFTAMFSKDPNGIDLTGFSMTADGENITATILLRNGNMVSSYEKTYYKARNQILYYAEFPYLAMWPYINADSWKEYYVAWCQEIRSKNNDSKVFSAPIVWKDFPLKPVAPYEDVSTYDNPEGVENNTCHWKQLTYNRFPEYVHFKYEDGGNVEVGAIYTKPPQLHQVDGAAKTFRAAIDFGSSNTIVRLMDDKGDIVEEAPNEDYRVFTNKYVQPLTMVTKQNADFYLAVNDFHEFNWLFYRGMGSYDDQIWQRDDTVATGMLPTVVEVYSGVDNTHNKGPRYGQLLRSNCSVMSHFLGERTATGRGNSLDALGIRSHIKMTRRGPDDPVYDGQIAIEMILLECALAAIEKNARLSFVLSYPDEEMWRSLRQFWEPAVNNAREICTSINLVNVNNSRVRELQAAHGFATITAEVVNRRVGYSILDIGGGTSDISLWMGNMAPGADVRTDHYMGGLSLKYAGDQLTAESIFSFYRWLSGSADRNLSHFKRLWDLDHGDPVFRAYEGDMERGFQELLSLNLGMASEQQKLHKQVPLLTNVIVSGLEWSGAVRMEMAEVQPFLALLRTKVTGVFYVLARYLQFMGAHNQDLNMVKSPYVICMAGNGSAAYQACGGGMTKMAVNILRKIVADRKFLISDIPDNHKKEVVKGMCSLTAEGLAAGAGDEDLLRPSVLENKGAVDMKQEQVRDFIRESYEWYVENILQYPRTYSGQADFFDVDNDTKIYQMLTLNNEHNEGLFNDYIDSVYDQVWNECEHDGYDEEGCFRRGTPNWVVAQIAAVKMVDKILLLDAYK